MIVLLSSYVPIVGAMVLLGYMSTVLEKFVLTEKDAYDDFDFDKLSLYLKRGVYPFCAQFAYAFAYMGLLLLFLGTMVAIGLTTVFAISPKPDEELVITVIVLLVGIIIFINFIFSIFLNFLIIPATISAALSKGFKYSFSPAFITGFIKRTWKEMILVMFFYIGLSLCMFPIVIIPGAVLLIYVVMGPLILLQWHIKWQLYKIYLERGGEAISIPVNPSGSKTKA